MNSINEIIAVAQFRLQHFTELLSTSTTDEMYVYRLNQIRRAKNQIKKIYNNQNLEVYEYKSRQLPDVNPAISVNNKRIICNLYN